VITWGNHQATYDKCSILAMMAVRYGSPNLWRAITRSNFGLARSHWHLWPKFGL